MLHSRCGKVRSHTCHEKWTLQNRIRSDSWVSQQQTSSEIISRREKMSCWPFGKIPKFEWCPAAASPYYQDVTWIPSEKWPSWRDWDVVCLAHTQSFVFKKNWRRPKADGSKMTDLSLTCTHNSDWAAHRKRTGLNDGHFWIKLSCSPFSIVVERSFEMKRIKKIT